MNLINSSAFQRAFRATIKKHPQLKGKIVERLKLLESEPFHPVLRTHKLKGNLAGAWSCTVDYDCRILFDFVINKDTGEEEILLINMGTHNEVY
jgi:addiction module RelE/StbE family toxin